MNNLVRVQIISFALSISFFVSSANAQVYKCIIDGKTVYSDMKCAYDPDVVKTNPNQNSMAPVTSIPESDSYSAGSSSGNASNTECAEKLERLTRMSSNLSGGSFSERKEKISKRNAARYEYEATCMSASSRDAMTEDRETRKLNNQLNDIQRTQREIQNRQRGYGY